MEEALSPQEARELNALLRRFDEIAVALWKLDYDPRQRARTVITDAKTDGIAKGFGTIKVMAKESAAKALRDFDIFRTRELASNPKPKEK